MLINFFGKSVLFDLIKPATSFLLFADNDFVDHLKANSAKRCWFQEGKDETSKLIIHTITRTNEMNVYVCKVQVIDERVDCDESLHCFPGILFPVT